LEKDSFFAQILHEASNEAGGGLFYRFWEKWGNARAKMIARKGEEYTERRVALREFWPGTSPSP